MNSTHSDLLNVRTQQQPKHQLYMIKMFRKIYFIGVTIYVLYTLCLNLLFLLDAKYISLSTDNKVESNLIMIKHNSSVPNFGAFLNLPCLVQLNQTSFPLATFYLGRSDHSNHSQFETLWGMVVIQSQLVLWWKHDPTSTGLNLQAYTSKDLLHQLLPVLTFWFPPQTQLTNEWSTCCLAAFSKAFWFASYCEKRNWTNDKTHEVYQLIHQSKRRRLENTFGLRP